MRYRPKFAKKQKRKAKMKKNGFINLLVMKIIQKLFLFLPSKKGS